MSTLETRMAGRRAEAAKAERRKKLILVGLAVLLAALLAYQLPKLLKRSSSSSATPPTSSMPATASSTASNGARSMTAASKSVSVKRVRVIHAMAPKDLFVPLVHDGSSASSSTSPTAPTPPMTPHSVSTLTTPTTASGATASAAPASAASASTTPAVTRAAHAKPAVPTAAVIWTNGRRQVVGLSQVFAIGDAQFRLVAVTRETIRIKVLGGAFAGRGQAITVFRGHRVKLANTATGVQYGLLFTQAGIAASSTNSNN